LKVEFFIAKRILFNKENKNTYTRPVINIAVWGIALGMIIMIMAVSMTKGFQNEIKEKIIGFASDIQISKTGIDESYESTPFLIDSSLYDRLNKHPLISHAQVYATKAGIIKTRTNSHGTILKGVGADFNWKFFKDHLVEGDTITLKDVGISREAIISKKIAAKLDLKLGDIFRVFFVTQRKNDQGELQYRQKKNSFKVKGIYQTGLAEEFDSKFIFIDLKRVRKLNKWTPEQIGGYEIYMKEETSFLDLFNKNSGFEHYQKQENLIKDEFYSDVFLLDVRSIFSRYIQFISWIDYMDMHIGIILMIILIVSVVNMSSALLILILEKTQFIGILKSLGATNVSIRKIFLIQSSFLIGKGILYGNIIALVICLIQFYFQPVSLDPDVYYVDGIPLDLNWTYWLSLNLLTIVICTIMLIIPSVIIAKVSPVKTIKFN
jgi:lipoprotein-releasing system permease protein